MGVQPTNPDIGKNVNTEVHITAPRESHKALTMEVDIPRGSVRAVESDLFKAHQIASQGKDNVVREQQRAKLYTERTILRMVKDIVEKQKHSGEIKAVEASDVLEKLLDEWETAQDVTTQKYNNYFYPVVTPERQAQTAKRELVDWDSAMIANREMSVKIADLVAAGKNLNTRLLQEASRSA